MGERIPHADVRAFAVRPELAGRVQRQAQRVILARIRAVVLVFELDHPAFVIAHEIAHHDLGHLGLFPPSLAGLARVRGGWFPAAVVQLMERRISRPGYEHDGLRKDLAVVRKGADKLRSLVDRLLDVSRIRSGRIDLDLAPTDVIALARNVALELAETTGREIAVHGPASSGDLVRVDAVRIEEVLTNIIDNAIKYGAVEEPIDLELADEPTRIRVAVSDRGPGIPAEDRDRIFEPFHRLSTQTRGVGLGLHIAREIMNLHGGSLTVAERPGGGTTFAITLPKKSTSRPTTGLGADS